MNLIVCSANSTNFKNLDRSVPCIEISYKQTIKIYVCSYRFFFCVCRFQDVKLVCSFQTIGYVDRHVIIKAHRFSDKNTHYLHIYESIQSHCAVFFIGVDDSN